jgi:hypothetical protein
MSDDQLEMKLTQAFRQISVGDPLHLRGPLENVRVSNNDGGQRDQSRSSTLSPRAGGCIFALTEQCPVFRPIEYGREARLIPCKVITIRFLHQETGVRPILERVDR